MAHVETMVRRREVAIRPTVANLLQRAGCSADIYREAMESVRLHARVAIHFHPDRLGPKRTTVAEALRDEGVFRNQFETGLSSGSVSAFRGGARDTWESNLFGRAYHADGVIPAERPKYGALELVRYPDGPIPRFGSCYFVLRPAVSSRTSFTFMGSEDPRATERLGTIGQMDCVMAALFAEIEAGGIATPPWPPFRTPTLGVAHLTVARFLRLLKDLRQPRRAPTDGEPGRVLDTQIEAQVHGPIKLHQDVELLLADPAFSQTRYRGLSCANLAKSTNSRCDGIMDSNFRPRTFQTISVDLRCRFSPSGSRVRMEWSMRQSSALPKRRRATNQMRGGTGVAMKKRSST